MPVCIASRHSKMAKITANPHWWSEEKDEETSVQKHEKHLARAAVHDVHTRLGNQCGAMDQMTLAKFATRFESPGNIQF